jgi:ATP-dependent helicase/nuclease subunit A
MGEFYANEEQMVRIFLRLYRALINYRDRAAKQGALETLRYGGIFKIKSKDEAESYLFSLRQETKEMSAYGKAQYLVKYLEMLMLESSEKTDANLKLESAQTRLQQMLENVVQDGFCDDGQLAENFATYIEKQLDRELSLHQEQDAVRFMNLHKAKGLEGNIVIWTMRNKSREFNKGAYRKDGKYYPSLKSRYGRWCSYEKNTTIYEEAKGETEREEIRLEYVMATRAKQVLIFMDNMNKHSMFSDRETVDKKEVTYNLQNLPSLEKMSDKTLNETAAQQQSNDNANDSDATEKMTIYRFDRSEASLKNIAYVSYRPSDFEHGRKRKSNTKAVKWKRPKGTEFGTTMHRSLELLLNRMMHLE